MRVLTFGWDYPPMKNGGLGVACQGLTEELTGAGVEVTFVLPRRQETIGSVPFRFATGDHDLIKFVEIESLITPYHQANSFVELFLPDGKRVRFL